MAFRVVKVNSRCKLETSLGYLVCRTDKEIRILLDEISVLIIENQQACLTSALVSELMLRKIRLVFCDKQHNPQGEVEPYHGCFDKLAKIKIQTSWKKQIKDLLWKKIVVHKIGMQANVLRLRLENRVYNTLLKYMGEVLEGDTTNREALAAKAYFSALFGNQFDRNDDFNPKNVFLNYGYSLILSGINREIAGFGYLNQLGIHHIGEQNPFNLGCDLVEPFRPFVDFRVAKADLDFNNYKTNLLALLSEEIKFGGKNMILSNAFRPWVQACLSFINEKSTLPLPSIEINDGAI